MQRKPYTMRDVRRGAELLAKVEKANRLRRSGEIIRPLWVEWVSVSTQFVHEHSFTDDCREYIAQNPDIVREITIPLG